MPTAIRLAKPERALLVKLLEDDAEKHPLVGAKVRDAVLDKILKSELTKPKARPPGIGWRAAANAMGEVLGSSLALPPNPDAGWCARMSGRIRDQGLSEDDFRLIARLWKAKWPRAPAYTFERAVMNATALLAEAKHEGPGNPDPPKPETNRPLTMEGR